MRIFRWKAIGPLLLLLAIVAVLWALFADLLVHHSVEDVGTEVVGARVDLSAADLQLRRGAVVLRGLQVANPQKPLTNLIEAQEIIARFDAEAALRKKVVIDTFAVRGVRFGTPRRTSGAIENPSPTTGTVARQVSQWVETVSIPEFTLEGIGSRVVDVEAISPDSLQTLALARQVVSEADSMRQGWEQQLRALDPRPQIDSARALAQRLQAANPIRLGPVGVRNLVQSTRSTIADIERLEDRVRGLEQSVTAGVDTVRAEVGRFDDARAADYAYARGLLKVPSLTGPDLSPALFGTAMLERLRPVLYWLQLAEEYLPPGLDPRRRAGPSRARLAGTTVTFPEREALPTFLLAFGELSLAIGGATAATGDYVARVTGLTTEPTIYARPLQFVAQRTGAVAGPRQLRVGGVLDHTSRPVRDSVQALVGGVTLPTIPLGATGVRLGLGEGTTQLNVSRLGDSLAVRLLMRAAGVNWERDGGAPAAAAPIGSQAWAEGLLWRTVSGIRDVEIEGRLAGRLSAPRFAVRSNVGDQIAQSLRRELGAELQHAEAEVRARVDALVLEQVAAARARLTALQSEVQAQVSEQRAEVERVKAELEQRLRELTPVPIP